MLRKFLVALLCALFPFTTALADDADPAETRYIRDTLAQQGLDKGLDKNPELIKQVEEFRKAKLADLALDAAKSAGMPDFSARAEELYETRKDSQYNLPLRLRVRVIEVAMPKGKESDTRQHLTDIRSRIADGKLDFKDAVIQYSESPERRLADGDSQWFAKGEKVDAIYDAALKLDAQHPLSDVVVGDDMAYLLYFLDRKEPEVRTLDEVKPEIITELQDEYRKTQEQVVLDGLRQQYRQQVAAASGKPSM
jgi:parvulin-like peptidyl-prolyl isomerase